MKGMIHQRTRTLNGSVTRRSTEDSHDASPSLSERKTAPVAAIPRWWPSPVVYSTGGWDLATCTEWVDKNTKNQRGL